MSQPDHAPIQHSVQPYYTRRTQPWAVANERQKHEQALYSVGEPAMFTLFWKVEDFEAGLVQSCPRCSPDLSTVQGQIAQTYRQPIEARCPLCYGTTFEGGIRAQIVRPAVFTDTDEDERLQPRGVVHAEHVVVETTHDFRSRTGDLVFRRDGSRWQLGHPRRVQVRTGYEHPGQDTTSIGYSQIPGTREDESSVAYIVPPSLYELRTVLVNDSPFPQNLIPDKLNGPLIPSTLEVE